MKLNLDLDELGQVGRVRSNSEKSKMISVVLSDRNRVGIPQSKIDNIKDGISFEVGKITYYHTDEGLIDIRFTEKIEGGEDK